MTDRDLLQKLIARLGKEPRAVNLDDDDHLVDLNLAGLDLEELPQEVLGFVHLRALWLSEEDLTRSLMRQTEASPRHRTGEQ